MEERIYFSKYHGTGNDFILVDDREASFASRGLLNQALIARLCHRHTGIGADGLILLQTAPSGHDFHMEYFNADGNTGSLCGNGGRCAVAFAHALKIIGSDARFTAADGEHQAKLIPARGNRLTISIQLHAVDASHMLRQKDDAWLIDTGSPHLVLFVSRLNEVDVDTRGRQIRSEAAYGPRGVNVTFVETSPSGHLHVRTYERGVEAETLSCGTGAVAAALAAHAQASGPDEGKSVIHSPGGRLDVSFRYLTETRKYDQIWLSGPTMRVFEGHTTMKPS